MKKLHCTLKVNAFEKNFIFPRLKKYCKQHKIKCTLQAEKENGKTIYRMTATAGPEIIDECAKELARIKGVFPGRIYDVNVVFA